MGRPLNKKYFGNRNVGSVSTSADDGRGGGGIDTVTFSNAGTFAGNSNVAPITIPALPAPSLLGGVQATWSLTFEVESVSTGSGKTNLAVGDTFGDASLPGMIAKVTDLSGSNAVFSVTTTGASRGDALALADIPEDTIGYTLTKIAGTGTASTFLVDVTFHVRAVTITEPGSGYTGAETFTFTKPGTTSGAVPAGTIVLTSAEENAIILYANVSGSGTTAAQADIIKQTNTRSYKVETSDGVGVIQLSTDASPSTGYGYMVATDSGGATYYVTKLTAHRATLVNKTGSPLFADEVSAPWTLSSSDPAYNAATTVIVENA